MYGFGGQIPAKPFSYLIHILEDQSGAGDIFFRLDHHQKLDT